MIGLQFGLTKMVSSFLTGNSQAGGVIMSKWCFNYDSDEYEYIDKDGYSWTQSEYVYNWDDSEYRREEELLQLDDEDEW